MVVEQRYTYVDRASTLKVTVDSRDILVVTLQIVDKGGPVGAGERLHMSVLLPASNQQSGRLRSSATPTPHEPG